VGKGFDLATLHPDLTPLVFLVGLWTGEGTGCYPTIEPFSYGEEIRISHVGKPYLAYTQRTWSLDDGRPLHAETGYWRCLPGGRVELVLVQPTGLVEVDEGEAHEDTVEVVSRIVGCTSSAKGVTSVARRLAVMGDLLTYIVEIATAGFPLQQHLTATLRRARE
jgi:hypothetical protein